jgi:hypothetical protein
MKTRVLVLLLAFIASSCYKTFYTVKKNFDYSEHIGFTIYQVQEGKKINTGNGYYYVEKGYKFVFVFLTFTNKTAVKQDLDLEQIYLLDPENKTKHKPAFSMLAGPVNMWGKLDSYINANDTKTRKIVFSFPEKAIPKYLMVNGQMVPISYSPPR